MKMIKNNPILTILEMSDFTFPNNKLSWTYDDPTHPGFVVNGLNGAPGDKAYVIHLEAKPGKEDQVQQFLQDINSGVNKEPLTGPWFGLRYSTTSFLIFEAFPSIEGRDAHDAGPGGQNFARSDLLKDILVQPAQIYRLDVLHGKFDVLFGKPVA